MLLKEKSKRISKFRLISKKIVKRKSLQSFFNKKSKLKVITKIKANEKVDIVSKEECIEIEAK